MQITYWALIVLLGFSWGSSFFFNEILLREIGPMMISMFRVAFGALGCWLWLLVRWKTVRMSGHSIVVLILFALVQYAVPLTVYPVTQQWVTSSGAGIVNAMTPIMVVLVSHFWPGAEKANARKLIGVALGFAGIVVLVSPSFNGHDASNPWALLATVAAPFCYGLALNLLLKFNDVNRTVLTAWSLTVATVMVAPVALTVEGLPTIRQPETWAALLVIGFVLTSGAFILLFWLIPRVGGVTASTITFIAPVSAVFLGVVVLKEELLWIHLFGTGLIFVGLLFIDGRLRLLRAGKAAQS